MNSIAYVASQVLPGAYI